MVVSCSIINVIKTVIKPTNAEDIPPDWGIGDKLLFEVFFNWIVNFYSEGNVCLDNTKVPNTNIFSLDHRYRNANHYSSPKCKNF